jgi:radical SAM protein with 4Fe4S-binding SPASM domain
MKASQLGPMDQLHFLAYEECIPLYVTLELTLKCNLRCVHCYNFDRSEPISRSRIQQELKREEIYRILEQLAAAGALLITFTGGEALSHPYLLDFVQYAKTLHFGIKIKSNATLLTAEMARSLVESGATEIDISLYGANAYTHDAFTTVPGSYQKTVQGIINAKAAGLYPSLSLVLHQDNHTQVEAMMNFADELGVACAVSTDLTARYDGTTNPHNHRMDRKALESLYSGPVRHRLANLHNPSGGVQCSCARTVCGINSVGDVYPCIGAPIFCGNLRKQSFNEIWNNSVHMKKIRGYSLEDFKSCKPCSNRNYCQRSSGAIYVNTGNYTGAEPWTCMEAEVIRKQLESGF